MPERPKGYSTDPAERKLREAWDELLRRRAGPIGRGIKPREQKLSSYACALVNGVEQTASESIDTAAETPATMGDGLCQRRQAEPVPETSAKRLRTSHAATASKAVTLCMRGINIP